MIKTIVYCPWNFDNRSGGQIALHKLADSLSKIEGVQSYIYCGTKYPGYGGIQLRGQEHLAMADEKTIVIYPEVINRNPLGIKNVVRYVVYTPGIFCNGEGGELSDENTYLDTDKYLMYDYLFEVKHKERIIGKCGCIEPFLDIYNNRNKGERHGTCYLIRKCSYKQLNWHNSNSIPIDGEIGNFKRLSDIFNHCHTFICYDEACFLTTQAALCGCLPIIIPKEGLSDRDWYDKLPTHKYGQSYGLEGLTHALSTQPLLEPFVKSQVDNAFKEVIEFSNYCKNWLNE